MEDRSSDDYVRRHPVWLPLALSFMTLCGAMRWERGGQERHLAEVVGIHRIPERIVDNDLIPARQRLIVQTPEMTMDADGSGLTTEETKTGANVLLIVDKSWLLGNPTYRLEALPSKDPNHE